MRKEFYDTRRDSFTLVEMLVSISILSIIILAAASMMGFVLQTWLAGVNSVNNFTKARLMLSLLDRDTQTMVLQRDLSAFTDETGSLSECAFFTKAQGQPVAGLGAPDARTVSLVRYYLVQSPAAATATNSVLERIDCGMNFVTNSSSGITPAVGYNTNMPQLTNNFVTALPPESVSTGVIAFQWQFVDGTGCLVTPPYIPSGSAMSATPFYFNFDYPGATLNPRTLVVSMVVISDNAYRLAVQTGSLAKLIAQFPTVMPGSLTSNVSGTTYDDETYAELWNSILNPTAGSFASGVGLSKQIVGSGAIQVIERHIPLPLTSPSS